jgi:tripartite ATP-independent transporter DctP family solute receptor
MMMLKMSRKLLLGLLMICVLVQAPFIVMAKVNPTTKNPLVVKLGSTDTSTVKMGDTEVTMPLWASMVAFKSALESYSNGRVKVDLYTNGRLGDNKSMLEQVLNGNLLVATSVDGAVTPFYKPIQVLSAPYVFKDVNTLWKVLQGSFGRKLFNDMAAKSGIRVLTAANSGTFRCFANNKKVVKVPADMKGLKIRTMDSPIFMEIVKASGALPTPIAWMELYSALQTGVVDGMENIPFALPLASLQEVLKFYTLNKHTISVVMLVTNEKFLKSLPSDLRKAFLKAGHKAAIAQRKASVNCDDLAVKYMKKKGMQVYNPTPAEMKLWEKTREPALKWLRQTVGSKLVDDLLKAEKKAEKK